MDSSRSPPSGGISTRRGGRPTSSSTCRSSDERWLACRRPPLLPSPMATPLRQPSAPSAFLNASEFLDLYAFERPTAAIPIDAFVEELKALVCGHRVEATLADALKYGGTDREALRRWIRDYYQFIRLDAQGTAAMVARCRRRGLFIR